MKIEKTANLSPENNLVLIVYGKGGVGKTTFAASAPKPLIIDFENGTKYLGERGIDVDVVRMSDWFTPTDLISLEKLMVNYDSIIIDPLGEAMEKLINSPQVSGKQYRQGDGSLTIAGWGEVKRRMRNLIKWLRDSGKNVIIVSHVDEVKTDLGLEKRIKVATGLASEIPTMVDVISYLGVQRVDDDLVRVLYTPAQGDLFDSKDRTGRIPMTVEVGERTGWADLMSAMTPLEAPTPPPNVKPPKKTKSPATSPTESVVEGRITLEQSQMMKELADKATDPAAKIYLEKMSAEVISYEEAENIVQRATAVFGGE